MKMMRTGFIDSRLMKRFGLPYAIIRTPRPYDTTTLNYNWQVWETKAFSLYAESTDHIDEVSADMAVNAILRFLSESGMIQYTIHKGYQTEILREEQIVQSKAPCGGIFRSAVTVGAEVTAGQKLGEMIDPMDAEILAEITAPQDGVVYYQLDRPLIIEGAVLYKTILRKR